MPPKDNMVMEYQSSKSVIQNSFGWKQYFNSVQLLKLYTGFIRPCSHIWGSSPYTSLFDRVESKTICLIGDPLLLTLRLFTARLLLCLFSTTVTLAAALMNWLPVFYLLWLGHIPHGRYHLPIIIAWNSPVQELIGSVMVSSLWLGT